ncbi:hypothetical protein ACNOYE_07150 [Nannocystaceae bacterium ST9]
MKRLQLHFFASVCCLPLLAVGCTDDSTGNEEIGETGTAGETGTDTDPSDTTTTADTSTTASDTTDTADTATTDTADTATTDTADTADTATTDTADTATTDTGTDTGTETGGTCGDGIIDAGEQCEGADLGGFDCVALGFSGGELLCGADCQYDASGCVAAECGNGVVEGDEACDGADLGGQTCADQGFAGGELACADDCSALITDGCNNCGNDVIDDGEACDGADLDGGTCVGLGYLGGTLSCSDACDAYVEDLCVNSWWGEDFEGGAVLPAEWVLSGNANWFGSATMPHAGGFNGESGNIGDSQTSVMEVTLNYVNPGTVQFWYRISTESGWDFLRFYIDGVQQPGAWSGIIGWTQSPAFNIAAGNHTLRWSYVKDGSVSSNSDSVWVDDIVTTNALLP